MSHVTFFIGNGFDLNVGLKTRYTDFYKIYTKQQSASKTVEWFKQVILQNEAYQWRDWADFEMGLAEQSILFEEPKPAEAFLECFNDFSVAFNNHLTSECARVHWDAFDKSSRIYQKFTRSIKGFHNAFRTEQKENIERLTHNILFSSKINFLQFNYTDVFDKLIAKTGFEFSGKNLHIHGNMGGGYHTMGVDSIDQIGNEKIRKSSRVQNIFVKPKFMDLLQRHNIHHGNERNEALKAISESSVICTFGSSIGETDRYWWKKVGEWLSSPNTNRFFIVFFKCGITDDGISPLKILDSLTNSEDRRIGTLDRFIRLAELKPDWLKHNQHRIIIEVDMPLFDFELPMKSVENFIIKREDKGLFM